MNEPGAAVAEYLQAQIFIADSITIPEGPGQASRTRLDLPGGHLTYHRREVAFDRGGSPLYADEERLIMGLHIQVAPSWRSEVALPLILWRIRANNAPPTHGAVILTEMAAGYWRLQNVGIDALPAGYSVEFAK